MHVSVLATLGCIMAQYIFIVFETYLSDYHEVNLKFNFFFQQIGLFKRVNRKKRCVVQSFFFGELNLTFSLSTPLPRCEKVIERKAFEVRKFQ